MANIDVENMTIADYRNYELEMTKGRSHLFPKITDLDYEIIEPYTFTGRTKAMIFYPHGRKKGNLPVFVNLHGGGFVLGNYEVDSVYCRMLSDKTGCVVLNVDYVLAPEYKFPTAIYECYDVIKYLISNAEKHGVDKEKIAIGGHSAGGAISTGVCYIAQKRKEFILRYLIVDYAPLDLQTNPMNKKSYLNNGEVVDSDVFFRQLGRRYNSWYFNHPDEAKDPLASPILAEDLTGFPPTLVISAELDPLAKEEKIFADKLKAAGISVYYKQYANCNHGFTHSGPRESAEDAWNLMCDKLCEAFER